MAANDRPDEPPQAVDVVEGIPDRSGAPRAWKVSLLGVLFALWVGLLICFLLGGAP